jgi:3-phosphoshikimate 1-carboxyvinyltransferase
MTVTTAPASPLSARPAPRPLSGRIAVPGDKSISHRALMFGALAVGTTRIAGLLEGEDVLRTAAAMRLLGAEVSGWAMAIGSVGRGIGGPGRAGGRAGHGQQRHRRAADLRPARRAPIFAVMTGDASLRRRPMGRVTGPLAATGAVFQGREGGRLPLAIQGARHPLPLDYTLPVASAQVKSACLLAGLCAPGITRVVEPEATRDHSENMLRHFGATVRVAPHGARGPGAAEAMAG